MAKNKTVYVCENCGQESPKWIGRCPSCGEWNTFKELHVAPAQPAGRQSTPAWHPATPGNTEKSRPVALTNIETGREQRFDTHDHELNRVLGGGIVPGSLILLGGEPGIGKSTLLLQTVLRMADRRILTSVVRKANDKSSCGLTALPRLRIRATACCSATRSSTTCLPTWLMWLPTSLSLTPYRQCR